MEERTVWRTCAVVLFWITCSFAVLFSPYLLKLKKVDTSALNVFMWSGVVDPQMFVQFTKETGIAVNVSHYEGNEELLVKLLATKGKGYDMIVPSDYVVEYLIKNNLLKKLDKSKLDFYDQLNPKLMGLYYDPKNDYSIPSEWYVLGLGYLKKDYPNGLPEKSWGMLFDPHLMPKKIGLINDSRELITLAAWHKYRELREINPEEVQYLKGVLCEQKKHAEAYTDFRGDFLLRSGNCSLVTASNAIMWKVALDDPKLGFDMPNEGVFLNIENYVIPEGSEKAEKVYKLMNFLFRLDIQEHNYNTGLLLPTRKDAKFMFDEPILKSSTRFIDPDTDLKAMMFQNLLTDDQVNEIWLAVKGE